MPKSLDRKQAPSFYKDVQPILKSDRPQIVFDMSETGQMDSEGLDILLLCLQDVIKSDGEVKLAGVTPPVSVLLELSRIGLLFGIYENSVSAAKSFSSFVPNASPYPDPRLPRRGSTIGADNGDGGTIEAQSLSLAEPMTGLVCDRVKSTNVAEVVFGITA